MQRLTEVYEGWDGYHRSLVAALTPLTTEQLDFRAGEELKSVREIAWHIADGRVDWFQRMYAPRSRELAEALSQADPKRPDTDLIPWLETTWGMVQATLEAWTVDDLGVTYEHVYQGNVYLVSRHWTLWRILMHDIHHGGQLSEALGMQGIFPLELTLLGGHLTEPPVIRTAETQ